MSVSSSYSSKTSNGHPKGLPFLFLTEMWERFGYYLMLGIFLLYMIDIETGGLSFPDVTAEDIFGTFIAFTYLTPFLGGFLADRKLGYINSVYIGGSLMGLGYIGLSFPDHTAFYTSIALIVIGNGFFKPSISTLLGNLYSEEKYIEKKDAGYNIFYMGINIGAFICNIIAAYMRNRYGWGAAFITAGVGMFVGLIIFTIGLKHYRQANILKPAEKGDIGIAQVLLYVFLPALIFGLIGWMYPFNFMSGQQDMNSAFLNLFSDPTNLIGSNSTDAFIFACVPVVTFFILLYTRANKSDKRPILALLSIFAVSVMFWAVFKQNGTVLTRWAKYYTHRQVEGTPENIAKKLYLAEELSTLPDSVTIYDNQFRAEKKDNGEVVKDIGLDPYFKNMPPEDIPKDGKPIFAMNTELFQSINPFWVVALTPLVVLFFGFLRRRGKEPTTPAKIAWGMLISAISALVMVAAVYYSGNGASKVSAWWLIACYGIITIGELFLSPMGLSLVSKLSPVRITALMMGGFFLSTSIGNKLSGILANTWYAYDNKMYFFFTNFLLLAIFAGVGFALLKFLNNVMREKGIK